MLPSIPYGKCTVIIGARIKNWYHANLMYRAATHALMFCGCIGVNGSRLVHDVGQKKLTPGEPILDTLEGAAKARAMTDVRIVGTVAELVPPRHRQKEPVAP